MGIYGFSHPQMSLESSFYWLVQLPGSLFHGLLWNNPQNNWVVFVIPYKNPNQPGNLIIAHVILRIVGNLKRIPGDPTFAPEYIIKKKESDVLFLVAKHFFSTDQTERQRVFGWAEFKILELELDSSKHLHALKVRSETF